MIYILGMSHIHCVLESAFGSKKVHELICNEATGLSPSFVHIPTTNKFFNEKLLAVDIRVPNYSPYWGDTLASIDNRNVLSIADGFLELIKSINSNEDDFLFSFILGEEYFMMGANYTEPYDFHLPFRDDLPIKKERQLISLSVIKRLLHYHHARAKAIYTSLRLYQPNLKIVNVACPPPIPKELLTDWFSPVASIPASFMNDSVRMKLWSLYVNEGLMFNANLGIPTLMPPKEAIDKLGLMKAEFCTPNDNMHGNNLYGNLILKQIENYIRSGVI